jgi:hypothetical protein
MLLVLILVSCGNPPPAPTATANDSQTTLQYPDTNPGELYSVILDKYRDVIASDDYPNMLPDIAFSVYSDTALNGTFFYALYDIDKNGVPEMMIKDNVEGIVGLFSIDAKQNKAVRLFANVESSDYFCGRAFLHIYENGYIVTGGSSGTTTGSECQYVVDASGSQVKEMYYAELGLATPEAMEKTAILERGRKKDLADVAVVDIQNWVAFAN